MSVIIVVGSSGSGKGTLVQGLVRLLHNGPGWCPRGGVEGHDPEASTAALVMPERQTLVEQAGATFDVYPASIATKYYNAQVSLWRQVQATVPILALRSADELKGLEGIVVLFDLRQEASFAEAAQWAAFVDDREQCALRICVGSKLDMLPEDSEEAACGSGYAEELSAPSEATTPAEQNGVGEESGTADAVAEAEGLQDRRARCLEWCLDHGFEYVEADCRDLERGGGLREKEGVPRIVEALQSNIWTGMEFCTDNRPSLMATAVAAGSGGGGGGNVGGISSVSGSSDRGDEPAASSRSMGDGEKEVSEYLSGFVDGDDGGGEYACYGALDSGGEDEDEDEDEDGDAEEGGGGSGGNSTNRESAEVCHTSGDATTAITRQGGRKEREDCVAGNGAGERGNGGVVDPAHVELQARWEQRGPGCSPPSTEPVGGEAATKQDEGGLEPPESVREPAPVYDGDGGNKVGVVVVKPGGNAKTGAGEPSNGPTGVDGSDGGGDGICGEDAAVGGREGGAGEAGSSATKSEEYLLKSAGAMVEGLGGDLEGDEMEQLMGEVRKARELGSSVPDAERRSRAADVAMRLAALLGELGDDSEDDDDER